MMGHQDNQSGRDESDFDAAVLLPDDEYTFNREADLGEEWADLHLGDELDEVAASAGVSGPVIPPDPGRDGDRWGGVFGLPDVATTVALRAATDGCRQGTRQGTRRPGRDERLRSAAILHQQDLWVDPETDTVEFEPIADRVRFCLDQLLCGSPEALSGTGIMADLMAIEELTAYLYAAGATRLARLAEPGVAGDPTALVDRRLAENPRLDEADDATNFARRELETAVVAEQLAVAQVGAVLHVAPGTASRRLHDAADLATLPELLEALVEGRIDRQRAQLLVGRTGMLEPELRRQVVHQLLPEATDRTPRQWSLLIDAEVVRVDPEGAERRRTEAVERRRLRLNKLEDGMGQFLAELPAEQAQLAWDLFDAAAAGLQDFDDRSADHRRADSFATVVELLAAGGSVSMAGLLSAPARTRHDDCCRNTADVSLTDPTDPADPADPTDPADPADPTDPAEPEGCAADRGCAEGEGRAREGAQTDDADRPRCWCGSCCPASASGQASASEHGTGLSSDRGQRWMLPTKQGRRTHATVVLTLEALAGLIDDPAELAGYGIITAGFARALAEAAATVSLLVTDPATGGIVGVGDRVYRPKQDLRDRIVTAYPGCVFTGCHRRAVDSDLDHRVTFDQQAPDRGGRTADGNLHPLCRHHHRLKTFGGWAYRPGRPGSLIFRSPLGLESTTVIDHPVTRAMQDASPAEEPPPF